MTSATPSVPRPAWRAAPLLAAALAAAAPAQEPEEGPPAPAPREEPWRQVSGVAAVVDGELVTWPELDELLESVRGRVSIETEADLQQLLAQLVDEMVRFELQARGGAELDIPHDAVDATIAASFAEELSDAGAVAYGEQVRRAGRDPLRDKRDKRKDWLRTLFLQRVQGLRSPLGQRAVTDTFVRPGELRAAYRDQRASLGEPASVRMQILDVQAAAAGGMEYARELVDELRAELEGGADFAQLVREHGARYRDSGGRIDWTRLDAIGEPELRRFLEGAREGDHSPVLVSYERSAPSGYQLVLVTERRDGSPPPEFDAPELQTELSARLLRARRDQLLARTDERLRRRAYVWVHPALAPPR